MTLEYDLSTCVPASALDKRAQTRVEHVGLLFKIEYPAARGKKPSVVIYRQDDRESGQDVARVLDSVTLVMTPGQAAIVPHVEQEHINAAHRGELDAEDLRALRTLLRAHQQGSTDNGVRLELNEYQARRLRRLFDDEVI